MNKRAGNFHFAGFAAFGVHPLGCQTPPNTLKRGHQTCLERGGWRGRKNCISRIASDSPSSDYGAASSFGWLPRPPDAGHPASTKIILYARKDAERRGEASLKEATGPPFGRVDRRTPAPDRYTATTRMNIKYCEPRFRYSTAADRYGPLQ